MARTELTMFAGPTLRFRLFRALAFWCVRASLRFAQWVCGKAIVTRIGDGPRRYEGLAIHCEMKYDYRRGGRSA